MKWAGRVVLLAALAAAGFWLWTVLFPSPAKIVLRKVAQLAATATVNASDGNIARASKAAGVVSEFAEDAEVVVDLPTAATHTMNGREEIREAAMGGLASVTSISVQFLDATATVAADKQSATVSCTARVTVGESRDLGIQELRFQFKKRDGDWLITRVETVQTLK